MKSIEINRNHSKCFPRWHIDISVTQSMSCPMSSLMHPESSVLLNSSPDMCDGHWWSLVPLNLSPWNLPRNYQKQDGYIQEKTNLPPPSFWRCWRSTRRNEQRFVSLTHPDFSKSCGAKCFFSKTMDQHGPTWTNVSQSAVIGSMANWNPPAALAQVPS